MACHPLPCLAVTVFASAYAFVLGAGPARIGAVALAVLAGQLCVGWSNDAIDGAADALADRPDKPITQGLVSRRVVAAGAVLAGLACVLLSFRLGTAAAGLHLAAVASALTYNAGLKGTLASPLPYVLSFGLLPVVTSFAVDDAPRPPILLVAAAALLGAAAHFGNTVGDAQADALTGVRGLPQRLGPQRSQAAMAGFLAAAAALLLIDISTSASTSAGPARRGAASALLAVGVIVALAGAFLHVGASGGRAAWRLTLLSVAIVVGGFLLAAS